MTIDGICDPTLPASKTAAPCKIQVTKAEFERMLATIMPAGMPAPLPDMKRKSANQLAQLMTVAAAGEKSGVLNTPEGEQMLKLAKLQALANAFVRHLQQTSKPTDAELQAYYTANSDKYQQAKVQQLFVPSLKSADGKPSDPVAQQARAEKFRKRAVDGEPFDKLQKEAMEGAQFPTAPPVDMTVQKANLPPARAFVFDLKDGEFSPVVVEPTGSVFYKMISKTTVPLSDVKDGIAQRMSQEKYQSALESVMKSATPTLNDDYFGPAAPQAMPGPHAMPGGPGPMPPPVPKQPK
jgi:hypothetical protein